MEQPALVRVLAGCGCAGKATVDEVTAFDDSACCLIVSSDLLQQQRRFGIDCQNLFCFFSGMATTTVRDEKVVLGYNNRHEDRRETGLFEPQWGP